MDWYILPVPFRKWFIKIYNKRIQEMDKGKSNPDEPMTQSEKINFIRKSQESQSPHKMKNFMQPVRNK